MHRARRWRSGAGPPARRGGAAEQAAPPGAVGSDGFIGYDEDALYTALIYVRNVRLADGKVWSAEPSQVLAEVRRLVPDITNFGDLDPNLKPRNELTSHLGSNLMRQGDRF